MKFFCSHHGRHDSESAHSLVSFPLAQAVFIDEMGVITEYFEHFVGGEKVVLKKRLKASEEKYVGV